MRECGLSGLGWGPVEGCWEHGNELSVSVKRGQFFHQLQDYQLKKDSSPRSQLVCVCMCACVRTCLIARIPFRSVALKSFRYANVRGTLLCTNGICDKLHWSYLPVLLFYLLPIILATLNLGSRGTGIWRSLRREPQNHWIVCILICGWSSLFVD